ncbi:MAG: sigma 54-interacting transcriptional regulator [Bradymonadales bacterium]|nr:sigma 54-interacting transcriptional regulator [Bradymonadales bacterium]
MEKDSFDTTTLVDAAIRPVSVAPTPSPACVVCLFSPQTGLTFQPYPIQPEGLTIGRTLNRPGDIHIEDHKASRRHAEIRRLEPGFGHALVDLSSTNGTRLNGIEIEREVLSFEDVIRVGNSLFVYCRQPPERLIENELLVGRSRVIQEAVDSLLQVAPTDLKVLLTGETGTGKELAAHLLHHGSGRQGPFVPVNCGSFPGTLIESELFGYVKGAFSGAERTKEGLISSAHRGTLFLDEIGEFPIELQPRLLRVLHDHEVRKVGATHSEKVEVRFLAATNQDIFQMVETNRFRRDLLARLNEWSVQLPPLRDRREDIGLLVRHFLEQREAEELAGQLDPDLLEQICLAPWPANVRELASAVARWIISIQRGESDREALAKQVLGRHYPLSPPTSPRPVQREMPAKEQLARVMALYEGNISGVARYYGKERQQIYRWLEYHGLKES